MREIKFRAWNLSDECMQSWHSLWTHSLCQLITDQRLILMQYTGLKDKNGKEIYEGDILVHEDFAYKKHKVLGVMQWEESSAGFTQFYPISKFEVIGNIYENPELLEAQK
jgi:uncharacterized phage protein (TIGR01671 family)